MPVHLEMLPLLGQVLELDSASRAGLGVGNQMLPFLFRLILCVFDRIIATDSKHEGGRSDTFISMKQHFGQVLIILQIGCVKCIERD